MKNNLRIIISASLLLLPPIWSSGRGEKGHAKDINFDGKATIGITALKVNDECVLLRARFSDSFLKGLKRRDRDAGSPEFTRHGQVVHDFPTNINIQIFGDVSRCSKTGEWSGVHERGFGSDLMESLRFRVKWRTPEPRPPSTMIPRISPIYVTEGFWTYSLTVASEQVPIMTPLEIGVFTDDSDLIWTLAGSLADQRI